MLPPESRSHGSLVVTPADPRSIPKPPLEKIELYVMSLPTALVLPLRTQTPAPPLKPIRLPAATLPPMTLFVEPTPQSIPMVWLPRGETPPTAMPIELPAIVFHEEFCSQSPRVILPQIKLPAPG